MIDENNNAITFSDVAGCDEAKEDVTELVDFCEIQLNFKSLEAEYLEGFDGRLPWYRKNTACESNCW